jgi:hypothetical protein
MPEHEPRGGEPEQQGPREHEREPHGYYHAVRFHDERLANKAYDKAQQLVQGQDGKGLSAYKVYLPDEPILPTVTVLGDTPPKSVQQRICRILQDGMPLTLPERVLHVLFERRAQANQIQPYVEGHWRPGKVFYSPKPPETSE